MNRNFEYELSLTELNRTINGFNLSEYDRQYLLTNIPQFFQLIVKLIKAGYFNSFLKNGYINFLDIGCHYAQLAFLREHIKEFFNLQGYNITIQYLGVDVKPSLISRLQNHFPEADGYFFRTLDASNSTAIREAMLQTIVEGPDVVLFKRPVMIGIGWQQWLWPFAVALSGYRALLIFMYRGHSLKEEVKQILLTLIAVYFLSHFNSDISKQYQSFLNIMTGHDFENTMILATNTNWIESLITKNRLSSACNCTVETGVVSVPSVYDLSWFHWDRYYTLIPEFHYQPHYFSLESILNSRMMASLPFLIAWRTTGQGEPLKVVINNFLKTALIHTLMIPVGQILWEMIPHLLIIAKFTLFAQTFRLKSSSNPLLPSLTLLLLFLPVVDGESSLQNLTINPHVLSLPLKILFFSGLMSLTDKPKPKLENKLISVTKSNPDLKQTLNDLGTDLKKIAKKISSLPENLKSQYQFILNEYQDMLEEIQQNPNKELIKDFKADISTLKKDLAEDLKIFVKSQSLFVNSGRPIKSTSNFHSFHF